MKIIFCVLVALSISYNIRTFVKSISSRYHRKALGPPEEIKKIELVKHNIQEIPQVYEVFYMLDKSGDIQYCIAISININPIDVEVRYLPISPRLGQELAAIQDEKDINAKELILSVLESESVPVMKLSLKNSRIFTDLTDVRMESQGVVDNWYEAELEMLTKKYKKIINNS